ncbi:MAG: CBS domain-containing protein [Proteobacteria bacterium]|nr:CBS domain-containing protein [Pseudomonadota bacterium]
MSIRIADLMAKKVITAQPHHTVGHIRTLMTRNRIQAVPVVDSDGKLLGIVTATDLVSDPKAETPVNKIMTERVYKVPAYNNVSVAARVMRKHKIHHVVITHEKEVTGIISSYDLLKLVEDHHFEIKGAKKTQTRKSA